MGWKTEKERGGNNMKNDCAAGTSERNDEYKTGKAEGGRAERKE